MDKPHEDGTPTDWRRLLDKPRVYVDLNAGGRVGDLFIAPLNRRGTVNDLEEQGIVLREGLSLDFWTDDGDDQGNFDPLYFKGTVHYHPEETCWVAITEWDAILNASQISKMTEKTPV